MTRSTGAAEKKKAVRKKRDRKSRRLNLRLSEDLGNFIEWFAESESKTITEVVEDCFCNIRASVGPAYPGHKADGRQARSK